MWMTSYTGSERTILGDLKKSTVENYTPNGNVDFRLLAEARPVAFVGGATRV